MCSSFLLKGSLAPCLVAARAVRWRPRLAGTRQYIFPSFPDVCNTPSCCSHWTYGHDIYSRTSLQRTLRVFVSRGPIVLHTFQSVNPTHGQWPARMGSWRVLYYGYPIDFFSLFVIKWCQPEQIHVFCKCCDLKHIWAWKVIGGVCPMVTATVAL